MPCLIPRVLHSHPLSLQNRNILMAYLGSMRARKAAKAPRDVITPALLFIVLA